MTQKDGVDEDETLLIRIMNSMRTLGYGSGFIIWCNMHNRQLKTRLKFLNRDKDV